MLLLNYGTAFQLSYAQLLLFMPLDADLKPTIKNILSPQILIFHTPAEV
jgi:hypothetical protein